MKCIISRTSVKDGSQPHPNAYISMIEGVGRSWCIDIDDVFNFARYVCYDLIVNVDPVTNMPIIEIYDGYRE